MPFASQAQQRWAFATDQPFAHEWADKTNFRHLPKRVKKNKEGNSTGEFGALLRGRAPKGGSDPHKDLYERDFDKGVGAHGRDRDKIPAQDFAGPHRSFPITDQSDVSDAEHLAGHAANPAAVKRKIKAIAKRKGLKASESEIVIPTQFGRARFVESF